MTEKQFYEITEWQSKTFGEATALSKIAHLKEEIEELLSDLQTNSDHKRSEWADCFILLFGAAKLDGMTFGDIISAIDDKMKVNYARKWGKPKENGVVNHIRTESENY